MVSTGIEKLDRLLGDGYPDRAVILVTGPSGIGKEALGYRFVQSGLSAGEFCLYITKSTPNEVLQDFGGFCAALVLYLVEYSVALIVDPNLYGSFYAIIVTVPPFFLGAYFLYRCARSLAPYTSSLEDPKTLNRAPDAVS